MQTVAIRRHRRLRGWPEGPLIPPIRYPGGKLPWHWQIEDFAEDFAVEFETRLPVGGTHADHAVAMKNDVPLPPCPPAQGLRPLLVASEAAAALVGVSRATWYGFHSSGRCPMPVKLGRRTLWNVAELEAWVAAGCPARVRWDVMRKGGGR